MILFICVYSALIKSQAPFWDMDMGIFSVYTYYFAITLKGQMIL